MGDFGAAVFAPEDDTRPFDDFHQDDYGTDACRAPVRTLQGRVWHCANLSRSN